MSQLLSRRDFLFVVEGAVTTMAMACRHEPSAAAGTPAASSSAEVAAYAAPPADTREAGEPPLFEIRELRFETTAVGPEEAVLLVPTHGSAPAEPYPLLVALHGRGESLRGVDAGAYGWLRDYDLGKAYARLRAPPLVVEDFHGFVTPARLSRINASLAERPFRGLVIVCPWVPDLLSDRDRKSLDSAVALGEFVVGQLLPRVAAETPVLTEPGATGVDGVSLGGRAALLLGLAHADRFGAVGSLQAAIQEAEAPLLLRRARGAFSRSPGLRLRLLTSDGDYFRGPIAALHAELLSAHLPHEHEVVPGPHDYPFNRGPGSIEMLLWHDRVLRGEPPL